MTDEPIAVRLVGDRAMQLAALMVPIALGAGVFIAWRWHRFGPRLLIGTSRRLRRWADRLEDTGLDMARGGGSS